MHSCDVATAGHDSALTGTSGMVVPSAVTIVVVHDLSELTRITRRGIAPSIPRGAQVMLDLLPEDLPARSGWERAVGRWASACGCEQSGLAFPLVIFALMALHLAGINLGLGYLPVVVWWIAAGLIVSITAKAGVVVVARHSLAKLLTDISIAARAD